MSWFAGRRTVLRNQHMLSGSTMSRLRPLKKFALVGLLAFSACPAPGGGGGVDAGGEFDAGAELFDAGMSFAASEKAQVKFKRNARLATDFAAALSIPRDSLCKELGQYSCADLVHALPLGGTEPYGIGLYEPLAQSGLTSPVAVDRLALAGCVQRVSLDLSTPNAAVIFKADPATGGAAAIEAAVDTLYKRVMLRKPTDAEVATLKQLHADIVAKGKPDPSRAWMTLACFAVLTSNESLFY